MFRAHIASNKQSNVLKALDDLSERHQRLEVLSVNEPERLKRDILAAMEKMFSESAKEKDLLDLKDKLLACENESSKLDVGLKVLERLRFPMINSRQTNIADAHSSTFAWILERSPATDSPSPKFVHWLESQDGIYWINGKAGSGKSTLMKFIASNKRTAESLRIWAGNHTLVTASYFLWKSGTDMQKSLEGLLRSLLYRILQQCPTMIGALPSPHTDPISMNTQSWSLQDLLATFSRLKTDDASARFCFFIDGLDEYTGFHPDIIDIIMSLITSANIKVCVSSRPWNIFEDAFGGGAYPSLRVHHWTKGDIRSYVMDNLEGDRHFARLRLKDQRYEDLVSQIAEKAQGVFLWVFLVVRSLLRGLTNADAISDLQRRLALLPSDLEKYFEVMLDSTEKVYHQQAARMLQICLASERPLSLITLSFYDEQDPEYGMKPRMERWTQGDLDELHQQMRKRVSARCVDLVEVTVEKDSNNRSTFTVEFLHTTVRDFLETKEIQGVLTQRQGLGFDPDRYLCQSYLAQMKHMPSALNLFDESFIFHAFQLESKLEAPQIRLMDEFLRVHTKNKSYQFDLTLPMSPSFKINRISSQHQRAWFLTNCVRRGLALYVQSQLKASDLQFDLTDINQALAYPFSSHNLPFHSDVTGSEPMRFFEDRAKSLPTLMDYGADPNYFTEGSSVREFFHSMLFSINVEGITQDYVKGHVKELFSEVIIDDMTGEIVRVCSRLNFLRMMDLI